MRTKNYLLGVLLMASLPLLAERVDQETAQKVAASFLSNNGAKSTQLTDLTKEAGFSNLYIFNAIEGFVVMAADDCVQPILGYSLKGKFVVENMPSNVSGWLQGYNDEIQYAIDNQLKASEETSRLWKDLANGDSKAGRATIVVDALIQSTWDQDPGYNDLCPYDSNAGELTVTGCVATAMAQIMRYWEFPSHGTSSHSYTPSTHSEYGTQTVNYAQATYDWANMPLHSPSAEIAKLMYHCGVSVDMMYDIGSNGGSGAYSNNIPYALETYFYYQSDVCYKNKSDYSNDNWLSLIKTELNAGRPVEYNGSGSGGGHAFVCDGYDNSNYFHFNWGWSGSNDGFYSLSNLVPGSGGSGGGSYSFTNNQSAVIGIQPRDCSTSTPSNFNVTTEGRNALLTWSAASNAAAYSIYRDGLLIANTTNTNYTDSNLSYKTHSYYVKSRDSYGAASSATTTITVTIEPVPSNLSASQNGNGAILNWTAPEWVIPQTDDEVLTYGDGSLTYSFGANGGINVYFGHRYQASMINTNKVLYKVSFFATETGSFSLYIYSATAGNSKPQTQLYTQNYTATGTGWNDIFLSAPLELTDNKDLWVFIYDPEGKNYPMGIGAYSESDDGSYISTSVPTSSVIPQSGYAMLIRTCITDGEFTYTLYDNNTIVAQNISGTSYSLSSISNNTTHQYTLKTKFKGSETSASNMAGLTIGSATLENLALGTNDAMTVTSNSTLTVNGTLSNNDPDRLIIEDEAQLIHHNDNVQATVQKRIEGYTYNLETNTPNSDGWYTIATPFTSYSPDGNMINGNYDLYYYQENADLEWINYKSNPFDITPGKGYLYAKNNGIALSMKGTLNNGDIEQYVELGYENSHNNMKGFNLLGNPTAHNITFTKTADVSDGYYYLDNSSSWQYSTENTVPAGRGFLVKANAANQMVTLNPQNRSIETEESKEQPYVVIDVDGEKVYVKLSEGVSMPQLNFMGRNSNLALSRDGKPFIMLVRDGAESLDLNYTPSRRGPHVLSLSTLNSSLSTLHLIDNLTGANIDLLANPTYSFNSDLNDYASRFRLVFNANDNDDSTNSSQETFAFINNDEIIITGIEDACDASLQVIDMLGRVIVCRDAIHSVSTTGMTPGVYVIRLIQGNSVKTQKIIVP